MSNLLRTNYEKSLGRTAVVKITLTEPPVGKRKQYDAQGEEMKSLFPVAEQIAWANIVKLVDQKE